MNNITLSEAISEYLDYVYTCKAITTYRSYFTALERFEKYFPAYKLCEIERQQVKSYFQNLEGSVSARRIALTAVRSFFNYLIEEEVLERNPAKNVRRPNYSDAGLVDPLYKQRALSKMLLSAIFRAFKHNPRYHLILLIMYQTGARISEACGIKYENINLRKREMYLHQTKGNKPRIVIISEYLAREIAKYLDWRPRCTEWLFPAYKDVNCHISRTTFTAHFYNVLQKNNLRNADGSNITTHQLRHTFATERAYHVTPFALKQLIML